MVAAPIQVAQVSVAQPTFTVVEGMEEAGDEPVSAGGSAKKLRPSAASVALAAAPTEYVCAVQLCCNSATGGEAPNSAICCEPKASASGASARLRGPATR